MRAAVVGGALALLSASGVCGADDPWPLLEEFRGNLSEQSPFTAEFTQSFVPEGFSTGEEESGRLALSLPDCLRWDYYEPYPKSFILCGDVIHYWNPGEDEGHVEEVDAQREPGLDLLLVSVSELETRYSARVESKRGRAVEITMVPIEPNELVAEATLRLNAQLDRLLALRYVDPEGNRTEFRISTFKKGVTTGLFNPPEGIAWLDDW